METTDALMSLLRMLYRPLDQIAAQAPSLRVILAIIGAGTLISALNVRGPMRWVIALLGLYLLGAVWMLPHMPQNAF